MKTGKLGNILSGFALTVTSLLVGCATERITAEYVVPPKAIRDLVSVNTIDVFVRAEVEGNASKPSDKQLAVKFLTDQLASNLGKEGYYQVTDRIWGNVEGASALGDVIRNKGSQHGYARITTTSAFKRARLDLDLRMKMESGAEQENFKIELKTIPFVRKDTEAADMKIPSSVPDEKNTQVTPVEVQVQVPTLNTTGILAVRLTDKEGTVVYERTFDNLSSSFKASALNPQSLPTGNYVISSLLYPACSQISSDLSPHKERRELIPNMDGDERAILLMQSHAFVEAIAELDCLLTEQVRAKMENSADYENRGLAYEVIGDYFAALSDFQRACELTPDSSTAASGVERMKKVLSRRDDMKEMKPQKNATQYKSLEFN